MFELDSVKTDYKIHCNITSARKWYITIHWPITIFQAKEIKHHSFASQALPLTHYIFCRLVSHIKYEDGIITPFDEIYQVWCITSCHKPESKKDFSFNLNQLFPNNKTTVRCILGKRFKCYTNIKFSHCPSVPETSTVHLAISDTPQTLIPTQYKRNGQHVFISIVEDSPGFKLKLFDRTLDFSDLGLGCNTPKSVATYVASKTRLCTGAPGGNVQWKVGDNINIGHHANNCRMVVPPTQSMCHPCKHHAQYKKGKENTVPSPVSCVTSPQQTVPLGQNSVQQDPASISQENREASVQSTEKPRSTESLVQELDTVLKALGMPEERATIAVDSARNEASSEKRQRRWSNRWIETFLLVYTYTVVKGVFTHKDVFLYKHVVMSTDVSVLGISCYRYDIQRSIYSVRYDNQHNYEPIIIPSLQ